MNEMGRVVALDGNVWSTAAIFLSVYFSVFEKKQLSYSLSR